MDTIPTPDPAPETPWKITGIITPAPTGLLYKLGATLTAIAMLLLPMLYLGIVGGWGWFLYSEMFDERTLLDRFDLRQDLGGWYYFLLVGGGITLVFMIKPLFCRRKKSALPVEITRAQQPGLFALIDHICALVRAPRPRRVLVDMQVNASASFSRGFGSMLRRDLTLTIGLPLVAGLSVRELGGVFAHEFGHFAQRAGLRMTYVIRATNAWLARIVYERDGLDEFLRDISRRIDIRIGIIFYFARLMVWLTRKILSVLMLAGHALSCFMLRQMEFDADHYETQVGGSESFVRTMSALRLLNLGLHRVVEIQQESFAAGRLVDDMPGLFAIAVRGFPMDVRNAVTQEAEPSKTRWFDTHPSDSDRVRAAKDAKAAGVLAGDAPATALFDNFSSVARQATIAYYQHQCDIELKKVQLLPLDTVADEVSARQETHKSSEDFFHGLLTVRTMLFLSPGELLRTPPRERLVAEWRDIQRRQAAALPGTEKLIKEMIEADGIDLAMAQAKVLLKAGFKLKTGQFGLAKPSWETADNAQEEARHKIAERCDELSAFQAATRDRLVAALRAYFLDPLPDGLNGDGRGEIERLTRLICRFDTLTGTLPSLRNEVGAFDLLLGNMPKEVSSAFSRTAREMGASMNRAVERVLEAADTLEYPFDHARGKVLLSTFLVETESHADESIHAFLRARALLDRFFAMYNRINDRLSHLGLQAEQDVFSGAPPDNGHENVADLLRQSGGHE